MPRFKINDLEFEIADQQLGDVMFDAIPEFMKNTRVAAPDPTSDLIRSSIKSAWALAGNKIWYSIYGTKQTGDKRADKLPLIWQCLITFLLRQMHAREIQLYAEGTDQGLYRIVKFDTSLAVQSKSDHAPALSPEGDCGCEGSVPEPAQVADN
jgi:hypothetical protein